MKTIVNLSISQMQSVTSLIAKYEESLNKMGYPSLGAVSVRITMTSGVTAVVDYAVGRSGYMFINVTHERPVLMAKPIINKDFHVLLDVSERGKLKFIDKPSDPDIIAFLDKEVDKDGHTNLQSLMQNYIPCEFASKFLRFAFRETISNGNSELKPFPNFEKFAEEGLKEKIKEYHKQHMLDGWDVVALTGKQLEKIGETLAEHCCEYDFDNNPLKKYCLSLYSNGCTQYYFFNRKGNTIEVGLYNDLSALSANFKINFKKSEESKGIELELDAPKESRAWCETYTEGAEHSNWEWCADAFFGVNTFMLKFGDVTTEVETKQAVAPSESQKKRKHNRNTVRLFKTYRLIKGWKSKARKKAEITCLAWGVRGHFRHYRNGKTVFVEAYVKGKERDKYKGKEYALLPYKDA